MSVCLYVDLGMVGWEAVVDLMPSSCVGTCLWLTSFTTGLVNALPSLGHTYDWLPQLRPRLCYWPCSYVLAAHAVNMWDIIGHVL